MIEFHIGYLSSSEGLCSLTIQSRVNPYLQTPPADGSYLIAGRRFEDFYLITPTTLPDEIDTYLTTQKSLLSTDNPADLGYPTGGLIFPDTDGNE